MIRRTWFLKLKTGWCSADEESSKRYQAIQERAEDIAKGCYAARIFLVYAPLTFGHSQLEMQFGDQSLAEPERFKAAAELIEKAVRVLGTMLPPICTKSEFAALQQLTLTNSCYVKTLILRASADENNTQYKAHLVPYFASHACASEKRYTSIHRLESAEAGGLIGWLGERETIADSWIKDNPFKCDLDKVMTEDFKMGELAHLLCREW